MAEGVKERNSDKGADVIGVTFSRVTQRRLEALAAKGTHGSGRTDVIRHFVEEGLRQAIKDGFISVEDGQG